MSRIGSLVEISIRRIHARDTARATDFATDIDTRFDIYEATTLTIRDRCFGHPQGDTITEGHRVRLDLRLALSLV